jgi:ABC-type transport system involved in multi-copper enzyme maturation permease subunit
MIAGKTWRELRGMALVYLLILELLLYPAIRLFPPLYEDMLKRPSALVKALPHFMQRWMEGVADPNHNAAYLNYMALQQFFKGINIAGVAAAVLFATGLIAREREAMTLEFLMARPVSRTRILWSKFWVAALCVMVPVFVSSWSALPLSLGIGERLPFDRTTMAAMHAAAFVLMLMTLTLLFSVWCRSQVHVAFWTGGIIVLQAALYFVQDIRQGSLFRLADFDVYGPILAGHVTSAQVLFGGGRMSVGTVWLLLATALLYAAAHVSFRRMDL